MEGDARGVSRFVAKNWPRVVVALKEVETFLKDHPEVPNRLRRQLDDIRKRLDAVQNLRGDAARIREMLNVVRSEARDLDGPGGTQSTAGAARWTSRADNIERRVRLAELQDQPAQKNTLAGLRAEAGVLIAELIDATANAGSLSLPQREEPEDEPGT
jgi:hypothetical protein